MAFGQFMAVLWHRDSHRSAAWWGAPVGGGGGGGDRVTGPNYETMCEVYMPAGGGSNRLVHLVLWCLSYTLHRQPRAQSTPYHVLQRVGLENLHGYKQVHMLVSRAAIHSCHIMLDGAAKGVRGAAEPAK